MSSGGNVEVKITGAVDSSLRSSTAQASATINAMAAEMGTATVASTSLAAATKAETAATEAATVAHLNSRVVTESLAAVHEVMQGRTSRLGGTLMILAQAATGASTGMLLMGAAAAGAVLGIGYLEYEALKARKAQDDLAEGFRMTGRGAEMSAESLRYNLSFLERLPGSNTKAADSFVRLVAQHAEWNAALVNSVGQLLPSFIRLYGNEAPQAAGKLMGALSDLTVEGFQKLDREMLGLNPTEYETVQHPIEIGDTAQATSRILADLANNSGTYIKTLGDHVYDTEQRISALKQAIVDAASSRSGGSPALVLELQEEEKHLAAIRAQEAQQGKSGKDQQYKNELDWLKKTGTQLDENTKLQQELNRAKRDEMSARGRGDQAGIATATQAEAAIQKELNEETYRNYVDRQNAEADAAKHGSQARIAAAQNEVEMAKRLFGDQSNEYFQALGRLNSAKQAASEQGIKIAKQAAREEYETAINTTRDAAAEILSNDRLTAAQRLDGVRKLWADFFAGTKLNAQEMITAKQAEASEEIEIEKQAQRERESIVRTDAEIQKENANAAVQVKKAALDTDLAYMRITAGEKIRLYEAVELAADKAEIAQLEFDQEGTAPGTAAWENYEKQIEAIYARMAVTIAQSNAETAKTVLDQWEHAFSPIETGFDSMINNMISGQKSFGAESKQVLQTVVESWISSRLKIEFDWLAGQAAMAFGAQEWANKSLFAWVASELGIRAAKETTAVTTQATEAASAAAGL